MRHTVLLDDSKKNYFPYWAKAVGKLSMSSNCRKECPFTVQASRGTSFIVTLQNTVNLFRTAIETNAFNSFKRFSKYLVVKQANSVAGFSEAGCSRVVRIKSS